MTNSAITQFQLVSLKYGNETREYSTVIPVTNYTGHNSNLGG